MNYRHHFHAGNFADAMKHTLLVRLVRALQRKEKGILFLDTHAGRGAYDLELAGSGDTLARTPEWPGGIGRLWEEDAGPVGVRARPESVADYVALVRTFDREAGNLATTPRYYPGSPALLRRLARMADRLALWEKHPAECAALRAEMATAWRTAVQEADGYGALRALLPPAERRALVLIDPPFEAQDEFAQIARALGEGLARFPTGVFAVWYPLTGRARVEDFFAEVRRLRPPPTLAAELGVAGEDAPIRLKGCGLLVVNPPWQFDAEAEAALRYLAGVLAQAPGGGARVEWVEPAR